MTTIDWVLDIVLIALVVLQLRERKLGLVQLVLPLILVAIAVGIYFTGIPTTTNGALLVLIGAATGLLLGALVAVLTRVWSKGGTVFARATAAAAGVWVIGMGTRLVFQIWANSPSGGYDITTFSQQNSLELSAWVDALLAMAVGQVVARTVLLYVRGRRFRNTALIAA
jgi:hypothetical protein